MQRVYQFHHFGKGVETYRRPWGKATLHDVPRAVCGRTLCRCFRLSYSLSVNVVIDAASRAQRRAVPSGADG
jgi:hypothetical protein